LFAAAHGISESGRFYLIPQDDDGGPNPTSLAQLAVDQIRLQDWLANRIKAKKAIVLLDTCESGALVGGYLRSRTNLPAWEAGVGRLHEAKGRPVLTATASGQFAHEGIIAGSGDLGDPSSSARCTLQCQLQELLRACVRKSRP
jgi:hypothetical protein